MDGDGSFRSDEITRFRDSADFVITNPPFSLFRDFIEWIMESGCKFSVIGSINAIKYKNVFPKIKENKIWLGFLNLGSMNFIVNYSKELKAIPAIWITNIKHGKLLKPLHLTKTYTLEEYPKYTNYDAIEVSKTKNIPIDYTGAIGVPISFLGKYCPEQFEIIGLGTAKLGLSIGVKPYKEDHRKYRCTVQNCRAVDGDLYMVVDGKVKVPYTRILIKHKNHLHKTKT